MTVLDYKKITLFIPFFLSLFLTACDITDSPESKPELLFYCGITMVNPMMEIASIVEKETGARIVISQGGSEDLYQSLKASRQGDLYLPGSASYRKRHLEDGLLGEFVHVGFNQAALFVARHNPKNIEADVKSMLRDDLSVVVCNPESGSIGRETKRILDKAGIYDQVVDKSVYLTTDSRNLNAAIRKKDADVIINWRATAFFEDNKPFMDVVDLDPEQAEPKKLLLNLLTFSKHPDLARRFMEIAASEQGQAIMRKYGFLDNQMQSR